MVFKRTFLCFWLMLGLVGFSWAQYGDKPGELPDNVDTSDCTAKPPAKAFDIKLKWQTEKYAGANDPHAHGRSTPIVGDVDGDGEVEIVIPWSTTNAKGDNNALRPNTFITKNLNVLRGKTGEHKYQIKTCDYSIHGQGIAIADVDCDGKSEIFIVSVGPRISSSQQTYGDKYIYCYDGSKANTGPNDYKWKSAEPVSNSFIPYVADMNNDGTPELVVGNCVFNAVTGTLLVKGTLFPTGMGFGGPHNVHGNWQQSKRIELGEQYYMSTVADIDGDNKLEICAGNTIYKVNITNPTGTSGNTWSRHLVADITSLPHPDMADGQTFVLDFDNDGDLDICVLGRNSAITNFAGDVNHVGIYVWDGQTREMIGYFVCDPKVNSPSIPFAGDIDGDGFPEIIFNGWNFGVNYGANTAAKQDQMHVFKFQKGYTRNDRCKAENIKYVFTREQTQEFYESAGFTVFDFNQDGKSEIVFRGTTKLYILDGTTLAKLCDPMTVSSGTTAEYPVVADVDQDGHADIIVTEEYNPSNGPAGRVSVFESKTPRAWGPAREVWNQWPYNVVCINEDLTVPKYTFNISTPFGERGIRPFNAFLQQATMLNNDGEMYTTAANAYIDTTQTKFTQYCDSVTIDITIGNSGTQKLFKPYGITIYKDAYKNDIVYQKTFDDEDLDIKNTRSIHLKYTEEDFAQYMPLNKLVISANDIGTGIAEEGGQQMECDTSNNIFELNFLGFVSTEYDTVTHHMCEGETYTIGNSIYTEEGTYVDTLVNRVGCDSIVTSYVYTHSISVDLGPDQSYCSKDYSPVTLDAGVAHTYLWQDSTTNRTFTVFETGDYKVTVYDEYGCSDSDSVNVTIIPNPEVFITKNTEDFCSEGQVTLTANSSVPEANYDWNTGETTQNITVRTHGTYTVIADNQGCTGTSFIDIPICPCEVWVPNAFSPNFDNVNDVFLPQVSNTLASYELIIFDRWGKRIFQTDDPNQCWDGTVKGARSPSNVFNYIINYTCSSAPDKKLTKNGSITLIR